MKLTNKYNLAQPIVDAVTNDKYDKGECDFSVTELIKPARVRALEKEYWNVLEEDVSDRGWSLIGQISHTLLERANRTKLVEKRFFGEIDGYKISGQIDSLCLENGILQDYKTSAAYAFFSNRPPKEEWVAQLNMQLELLRQNDLDAKSLEIVGIVRDFQLSKVGTSGYPKHMFPIVPIPLWDREKTRDYMSERIKAHIKAIKDLPRCTAAEAWAGRRCKDYCLVSQYCAQYKKAQKTGLIEGEVNNEV